jgi:hypothetical protein
MIATIPLMAAIRIGSPLENIGISILGKSNGVGLDYSGILGSGDDGLNPGGYFPKCNIMKNQVESITVPTRLG